MAATTHLPPSRGLTPAQHAALLLVLLVHSPLVRALRGAVLSLSSGPLRTDLADTAPRSVCTPHENATPGAGTPGVAASRTLQEKQDMQSLPHQADVGAPAPAATPHDPRPAQHAALLRWHANRAIGDVIDDLQANPDYPLITCAATPCAFARARSKPAPAPQDGAA